MLDAPLKTDEREGDESARALLEVVGSLARELRSNRGDDLSVTLDSSLERDLGLDSLGRAELIARIERTFSVSLPDSAWVSETPRELLRAVLMARGGVRSAASDLRYEAPEALQTTPGHVTTLLEVLNWHVDAHPDRVHIHLYEEPEQPEPVTYAQLRQGAERVAQGLAHRGLERGQGVAIMLPTCRGYFFSFFGALLGGGIPVPIYPPVRPSQIEEHLRRHARILDNAQAAVLITVPEAKAVARLLQTQVATLRHVVTVEEISQDAAIGWGGASLAAQDIAFLQYTSGTTGDPKGVVLTHANLLANLRAMGERVEAQATDVFVSWLPLYHDMGLIGAWFGSLYHACPLVVMSPLSFLSRPARWLWAIHRHHGTLSAAPNFAYELCLRHIDDADIQGLDLSSLKMTVNGAEPVSRNTMERFGQRFASYGLRPEALTPVYGLAECSVGLALAPRGRGLVIDSVKREQLAVSGRAEPALADDPNPLRVVGCGTPLSGHQIRIVDDTGRELPDRREGRLQFQGPSATHGYYRNAEATRQLFDGPWLNSGDRAYLANGEVYPTGRVKDVIIRAGRNIYPYELEDVVGQIDNIRKGCVAVFACPDEAAGTERLIIVAETRESDREALGRLRRDVSDASVDLLGVPPDEVILARPHAVLKTSSGKIRRGAIRELYRRNALGRGTRKVWWQLVRVAWISIPPTLRRARRLGTEFLYAGYVWTLFGLLAPLAWCASVLLPRLSWRWQAIRGIARTLLRASGTRINVDGLENLPRDGPCIVVSNHTSYLDALVLTAAIPGIFSFVAKRELLDHIAIRVMLRRLDTLFVERFDFQRSVKELERVIQTARAGRSLVFFPEGTFDRVAGMLRFRLGAFVAAAKVGIPVVPVALRGTRSMLRSGTWFPRSGSIQVTIATPIEPEGGGLDDAVQLRDAARQTILRCTGEPDRSAESPVE